MAVGNAGVAGPQGAELIPYPTVAEVLALPVVRQAQPRVVAGAAGSGRGVRWVHVSEVADIAHLLRGGELVLTTGIALPADARGLTRYVDELAEVGVAALGIEMVRRWRDELPPPLPAAADRRCLPLVTLGREIRFVAVTEAVAGLIRAAELTELRAAEAAHQAFTALTVAGAGPAEVLAEVVRAARTPVVLETLSGDVLAYDAAGYDADDLLADWRARSQAVRPLHRTDYEAGSGWLVTMVGSAGADWARLVLLCQQPPGQQQVVVAERAASALTVHRLLARDRETLERQTHAAVLAELASARLPSNELLTRAAALGVPLADRLLTGVAVCLRAPQPGQAAPRAQEALRDIAEASAQAARQAGVPALTGKIDDVRGLVSLDRRAHVDAVISRLARMIHQRVARLPGGRQVVVAVGSTVDTVGAVQRTLAEAGHVAHAALRSGGGDDVDCHRLADVRLRGLLHLLRDDDRLAGFVGRELGPLLSQHEPVAGLVDVLRSYCRHAGNISAAAAESHRSRTAFYHQVARVERVLGRSLREPESMLSVYVAILAADTLWPGWPNSAQPGPGGQSVSLPTDS